MTQTVDAWPATMRNVMSEFTSRQDFYTNFYQMRETLFAEDARESARARAFYVDIVRDDAIVRLTVKLRLRVTEGGQDWELEAADPTRTAEFLDAYETHELDGDERYYLLELIIASLDRHMRSHRDDGMTARVRRHVVEAYEEHRHSVRYWARLDRPEEGWAITPLMREIWMSQQPVAAFSSEYDPSRV